MRRTTLGSRIAARLRPASVSAAALLGVALPAGAQTPTPTPGPSFNYVDFFATLPPFLPTFQDQIDESPGSASTSGQFMTFLPTLMPGGPTPGGSGYYVDARSSYARVEAGLPYDGTQVTPMPQQSSYTLLDVNGISVSLTPLPLIQLYTGTSLTQSATGSHTMGSPTALAHVEFDVDLEIVLTPQSSVPAAAYFGQFGVTLFPPSGPPQFFDGLFDLTGPIELPDGLTFIQTEPGRFSVSGTLESEPFGAPTDGASFEFGSVFFVGGAIDAQPTPGLLRGMMEVDGSDTVVARLVSDDPNATFSLPIPSPEPAVTLLGAVAIAVLVTQLRQRDR